MSVVNMCAWTEIPPPQALHISPPQALGTDVLLAPREQSNKSSFSFKTCHGSPSPQSAEQMGREIHTAHAPWSHWLQRICGHKSDRNRLPHHSLVRPSYTASTWVCCWDIAILLSPPHASSYLLHSTHTDNHHQPWLRATRRSMVSTTQGRSRGRTKKASSRLPEPEKIFAT